MSASKAKLTVGIFAQSQSTHTLCYFQAECHSLDKLSRLLTIFTAYNNRALNGSTYVWINVVFWRKMRIHFRTGTNCEVEK